MSDDGQDDFEDQEQEDLVCVRRCVCAHVYAKHALCFTCHLMRFEHSAGVCFHVTDVHVCGCLPPPPPPPVSIPPPRGGTFGLCITNVQVGLSRW